MSALHTLHPHPTIPALANLREQVLRLDRKRKPKWAFRLAPDLIVQLQPWDERQRLIPAECWDQLQSLELPEQRALIASVTLDRILQFKGKAMIRADGAASFEPPDTRTTQWTLIDFGIYADPEIAATFIKAGRIRGSVRSGWETDVHHLRAELQPERFAVFTPELMLRPACLICSKTLTDPVSMARWIGPECAGTSSLRPIQLLQAGLPLGGAA